MFKECILNIISQFFTKQVNQITNNKKTDILRYYISKKNSLEILNLEDINKLIQEYNEINFVNINSKYSEDSDGEPDLIIDYYLDNDEFKYILYF